MRKTVSLFCLFFAFVNAPVFAETSPLKAFEPGSYQTLLNQHQDKPMMLVLWSITCSSCLKELQSLKSVIDKHPGVSVVTVSVDDFSEAEQVNDILANNQLNQFDNWLFSENNSAKLRFQIDPGWYGELPRTYFFDVQHNRNGISGILSEQDYDKILTALEP